MYLSDKNANVMQLYPHLTSCWILDGYVWAIYVCVILYPLGKLPIPSASAHSLETTT